MLKILERFQEEGKISKEVAEALDTDLGGELKSLRTEAAENRTKAKELSTALEHVEASKKQLEDEVSSIDDKIKAAKEEGQAEVVTELEALKAEKESLQENLQQVSKTNQRLMRDGKLSEALSKYDVIDADVVSDALRSRVQITEQGAVFKDGETTIPLEQGLEKFFEAKPNLLKAAGNPGSGTQNRTNEGKEYTAAEFSALSAEKQAELISADPTLVDKL